MRPQPVTGEVQPPPGPAPGCGAAVPRPMSPAGTPRRDLAPPPRGLFAAPLAHLTVAGFLVKGAHRYPAAKSKYCT